MSRDLYLKQNLTAIVFFSFLFSLSLTVGLFILSWGWFADWPSAAVHFNFIKAGLIKRLLGDSRALSLYFEFLDKNGLLIHFYVKSLTIIFVSWSTGILISVKLFYVSGGISSDVFLSGQRLISGRNARLRLTQYSKSITDHDSLLIHPHLKIPVSKEVGNFFIYGQQGSGKSVIVKNLIDQILQRRDKAIIYDEKREYTEILLGENVFLISPTDARSFYWNISLCVSVVVA
jgi:hypothetical protein